MHEIASADRAELRLPLVRGLADMETAPHQQLIALGRGRIKLLDPLYRGLATELEHDVALRASDRERLSDGAAALRYDRGRALRAFEDRADGAFGENLVIGDEPRPARDDAAGCHPADDRQPRRVLVQVIEEQMRREGVRVGEHHQDAVGSASGYFLEPVEDAVLLLFRVGERERSDRDARERRRPRGDGWRVLALARPADDAARDAPKERPATEPRVRALEDALDPSRALGRDEKEREVGDRSL